MVLREWMRELPAARSHLEMRHMVAACGHLITSAVSAMTHPPRALLRVTWEPRWDLCLSRDAWRDGGQWRGQGGLWATRGTEEQQKEPGRRWALATCSATSFSANSWRDTSAPS